MEVNLKEKTCPVYETLARDVAKATTNWINKREAADRKEVILDISRIIAACSETAGFWANAVLRDDEKLTKEQVRDFMLHYFDQGLEMSLEDV